MQRILRFLATLLLAFTPLSQADEDRPQVLLSTTKGDIVLELYPEKAPETVENFLSYVREDFYDHTIFHRVIDGFMIQGGGFTSEFERKPTRQPIRNEADNGLSNSAGTIAMARTRDPHSATAQFFINVANNTYLDFRGRSPSGWGYTVFGRVTKGMDTMNRIKEIPTGAGGPFPKDVPVETVIIREAKIINEE